jgi:hypothetical protein
VEENEKWEEATTVGNERKYNNKARCRNLSHGLATKARACKGASQKKKPGVKEGVRE